MNSQQETFAADLASPHINECSVCRAIFTKQDLIDDPGAWHVTYDYKIVCDGCDEARRSAPHEQRELEQDGTALRRIELNLEGP